MRPDVLAYVKELARGLWIVHDTDGPILIIKTRKEMILTARERREFRFYLAPCIVDSEGGLTLLTAFFDDPINPLMIYSPLVRDDALPRELKVLPDNFRVCFFDEHDRELLSCEAKGDLATLRAQLEECQLLPVEKVEAMLDRGIEWFSATTDEDDLKAVSVKLVEDLFPSDFLLTDMNQQYYRGSPGYSHTHLERPEPGRLQEVDIILLLQRVFDGDRIVHGPLKTSDGEELVDVLILGDEVTILIQAKDSPNTGAALATSLERKRSKTINQIKGGLSQLKGALSTIRREGNPKLRLSGEELAIELSSKPVVGIVVVKELFMDSYEEYGELIFDFMDKHMIPTLVFDYSEFEVMTRHCRSEPALSAALYQIFECARDRRIYPRLRFKNPPPL